MLISLMNYIRSYKTAYHTCTVLHCSKIPKICISFLYEADFIHLVENSIRAKFQRPGGLARRFS